MNLNNYKEFSTLDSYNMLGEIKSLPEQIMKAWNESNELPLSDFSGAKHILVAGMGGSAIGADLVKAYTAPLLSVPFEVHRNYGLPAWANGPDTLVIVSSHSGNTEETISAMETAIERKCSLITVTTGGKLAEIAKEKGINLWQFDHKGQPRAALGYNFCLLLRILTRINFINDPEREIVDAVNELKERREMLAAELPDQQNSAKQLASQLIDRWVSVFGADFLAPVARRWKGQISELAKAWGQFEELPEADHNTLAGVVNPKEVLSHTTALFLKAESNHPRNQRRIDLTSKNFNLEGITTDLVQAKGKSRLAQMWTMIQFGDFTAYYLAMAYDVDPTPVPSIERFKREL